MFIKQIRTKWFTIVSLRKRNIRFVILSFPSALFSNFYTTGTISVCKDNNHWNYSSNLHILRAEIMCLFYKRVTSKLQLVKNVTKILIVGTHPSLLCYLPHYVTRLYNNVFTQQVSKGIHPSHLVEKNAWKPENLLITRKLRRLCFNSGRGKMSFPCTKCQFLDLDVIF